MRCSDGNCSGEAIIKGFCRRCYNRQYMKTYDNKWKKSQRGRAIKRELNKKHYEAHPQQQSVKRLRNSLLRVGISLEEYEAKLKEQDNKCAICRRLPPEGKRLALDHCHTSGRFRSLLCGPCNTAIGLLGDDPVRVCAAADYLFKHQPMG